MNDSLMIGKQLSAMWRADRSRAKPVIRAALERSGGSVAGAARELKVSIRQMWRFIGAKDGDPSLLVGLGHSERLNTHRDS